MYFIMEVTEGNWARNVGMSAMADGIVYRDIIGVSLDYRCRWVANVSRQLRVLAEPACTIDLRCFLADTKKPLRCTSTSIGSGKDSRWRGKNAFPFAATSLGWTTCVSTPLLVLRSEISESNTHKRETAPSITAATATLKDESLCIVQLV